MIACTRTERTVGAAITKEFVERFGLAEARSVIAIAKLASVRSRIAPV
jgi:hypothetical protein